MGIEKSYSYKDFNAGGAQGTKISFDLTWDSYFQNFQPPSLDLGSLRDNDDQQNFKTSSLLLGNDILKQITSCIRASVSNSFSDESIDKNIKDRVPSTVFFLTELIDNMTLCDWVEAKFPAYYDAGLANIDDIHYKDPSVSGLVQCLPQEIDDLDPVHAAQQIIVSTMCTDYVLKPTSPGLKFKPPKTRPDQCGGGSRTSTPNTDVTDLPNLIDIKVSPSVNHRIDFQDILQQVYNRRPINTVYGKEIPSYYGSNVWITAPDILETSLGEISFEYAYDITGLGRVLDSDYTDSIIIAKELERLISSKKLHKTKINTIKSIGSSKTYNLSNQQKHILSLSTTSNSIQTIFDRFASELYSLPTELTVTKDTIKTEYNLTRDYLIGLGLRPVKKIKKVLIKGIETVNYELLKPKAIYPTSLKLQHSKYTPGYQTHRSLLLIKQQPGNLSADDIKILADFEGSPTSDFLGISQIYPNHTAANTHLTIGKSPNLIIYETDTNYITEIDLGFPTQRFQKFQIPNALSEPQWWYVDTTRDIIWYLESLTLKKYNYKTGLPAITKQSFASPPDFLCIFNHNPVILYNGQLTWGSGNVLSLGSKQIIGYNMDAERIDLYLDSGEILRCVNNSSYVYSTFYPYDIDSEFIETLNFLWIFENTKKQCSILNKASLSVVGHIPYGAFTNIKGRYISNPYHDAVSLFVIDQSNDIYEFNVLTLTSTKIIDSTTIDPSWYPIGDIIYQVAHGRGFSIGLNNGSSIEWFAYKSDPTVSPDISLYDILTHEYKLSLPTGYLSDITIAGGKIETNNFFKQILSLLSPLTPPTSVHTITTYEILESESISPIYTTSAIPALTYTDSLTGEKTFITFDLDFPTRGLHQTPTDDVNNYSVLDFSHLSLTSTQARIFFFDLVNLLGFANTDIISISIHPDEGYSFLDFNLGDIVKTDNGRYWKIIKIKTKYRLELTLSTITYPKNYQDMGVIFLDTTDYAQTAVSQRDLMIDTSNNDIHVLPFTISDTHNILIGYTSNTDSPPERLCIKDFYEVKCVTISDIFQPLSGVGQVSASTVWKEVSQFNDIDYENSITIEFNKPMFGKLASTTYEELLDNPFTNLIIVGYEAIQFMSFTISPDGKTVTFHGGLLRGRFNTRIWMNKHRINEPAYLINNETEIISFKEAIDLSTNVISIFAYNPTPLLDQPKEEDYNPKGAWAKYQNIKTKFFTTVVESETTNDIPLKLFGRTHTVGTDIFKYTSAQHVDFIAWRTPTDVLIKFPPTKQQIQVSIAFSPFILGDPAVPNIIFQQEYDGSSGYIDIDISNIQIPMAVQYLYFRILPIANKSTRLYSYPYFGILDRKLNKFTQIGKQNSYILLEDRNTVRLLSTSTYILLTP